MHRQKIDNTFMALMTVDHLLMMRFKPFDHLESSSQDIYKRVKSFTMAAACFYTVQEKICGHMGLVLDAIS